MKVLNIILGIVTIIVVGFTVAFGWNEFVLRVFELPQVSVPTAIGLTILFDFLRLKTVEEVLPKDCFFRLGSSHIVNLRQIDQVNSSSIVIEGKEIPVSRLKKKEFMEALHKQYLRR